MSNSAPKHAVVGIPTIVCDDLLVKAVDSVMAQKVDSVKIILICNGPKVRQRCIDLAENNSSIIVAFPEGNLGVSGSWNLIAETAFDGGYNNVTIIGDDLQFTTNDSLSIFLDAVKENPNSVYYVYNQGFSAFCLPKFVWDKIGKFDDGFWPGYFEDNDYYRRMMLNNVGWQGLHIETEHPTSSSINTDERLRAINQHCFPLNKMRYVAKWGGEPHNETFTIPWNGGEEFPRTMEGNRY